MQNINDAIGNDIEDIQLETEQEPQVEGSEQTAEPAERPSLQETLTKAYEKHAANTKEQATQPVVKTEQEQPSGKIIDPITGRESEPIKAPAGWTPMLREKWSSIDPLVQKFITDRELNMAQTMSKTADQRKLADEFREIVQPFENTFRQYNVTAAQATKEVMGQWHTLQTGSPVDKAHLLDRIIRAVKPDISTLIALANGQQPQAVQQQPQPNVDELVNKKLAARDEQAQQELIASDIDKFSNDPSNEYFHDVRDAMSRILSADLVTGDSMSEMLKKAYDLACSQHPEISQLMAARAPVVQRQAVKPVQQVKRSLGNGVPSKQPTKKMSLEQLVEAAYDKHMK